MLDFEVGLGVGGAVAGTRVAPEGVSVGIAEGGTATLIALGAEVPTGRRLWFGGGLSRLEIEDPFSETGSRALTSAELRARAHLSLGADWGVDLLARGALTHWGDDGNGSLVGWGLRLGLGGVYRFADGFAAVIGVSHLRFDTFDTSNLAETPAFTRPIALATWLLSVGVRVF